MSLTLTEAPAIEPISLAEAKLQCRISDDVEDSLVTLWISAARRQAERITRRALITQTWAERFDGFPPAERELKLGKPPVRAISSIAYIDATGAAQVLDASAYALDVHVLPGYVYPAANTQWPDTDDVINAVTVTYTAGYGDDASDVPEDIRGWMLMVINYFYEQRTAIDTTGRHAALPNRFTDGLLDDYIVYGL